MVLYKGVDGPWYIGNDDYWPVRSKNDSFDKWEQYNEDREAWIPVAVAVSNADSKGSELGVFTEV